MDVTIVIPTKNEEDTIGSLLTSLKTINGFKCIVVDDGDDRTKEIAKELGAEVLTGKGSISSSVKYAIENCQEFIITMDADGCLPPETMITISINRDDYSGFRLYDGKFVKQKMIKDIEIGDMVLSYDEKTGKKEWDKVVNKILRIKNNLSFIRLSNGNELRATGNHEIYTYNRGWIRADALQIDDKLIQYKYQSLPIRLWNIGKRGRCLKDIYGEERSNEIKKLNEIGTATSYINTNRREKQSILMSSIRSGLDPIYKNDYVYKKMCENRRGISGSCKGKTYEQIYGSKEAADAFNEKRIKAVLRSAAIHPNICENQLGKILEDIAPGEFKFNDGWFILNGKIPDFVNINGKKKLIEFNGCYWHNCKECDYGTKDEQCVFELQFNNRVSSFSERGYETMVVWEHELRDIDVVKKKILDFICNPMAEMVSVVDISRYSKNDIGKKFGEFVLEYIDMEYAIFKRDDGSYWVESSDRYNILCQSYDDAVDKISELKSQLVEVWDIETEKNHNFFAYGLLVHNSHSPSVIPDIIKKLMDGVDLVVGSRYSKGGNRGTSSFLSPIGNAFARFVLRVKTKDLTGGFIGCHKNILLDNCEWKGGGEGFIELIHNCERRGLKVVEIPFTYAPRDGGVSKTIISKALWRYFWRVIGLKINVMRLFSKEYISKGLSGDYAPDAKHNRSSLVDLIYHIQIPVYFVARTILSIPFIGTVFGIFCQQYYRGVVGFFLRGCYWKSKLGFVGKDCFFDIDVSIFPNMKNVFIDDNCFLESESCLLSSKGTVRVGKNCHIGYGSYINGSPSLVMGRYSCIDTGCRVFGRSNLYEDENGKIMSYSMTAPSEMQNIKERGVVIGRCSFLGPNSTLVCANIGNNSVVGANSFVNRDIEDNCICAGSPAKIIKWRK